jgi:signal peptidase II
MSTRNSNLSPATSEGEENPRNEAAGDVNGPAAPAPELAQEPAKVAEPPLVPRYGLLAGIAGVSLILDYVTKVWAVDTLGDLRPGQTREIIDGVLGFTLAYNKGGAFSMGASVDDTWRAPFFLVVGLVAVGFIISLYRKVQPEQWALRYGLPLVLGGALGNLTDRVTRGKVVDFIDYRAGWVELMNSLIAKVQPTWHVTDHWPTFNVADMCICVGVGLMAIDMIVSGRSQSAPGNAAPRV